MYENRSDSEHSDDDEQTDKSDLAPQRIGFNPFSLPFSSQSFSSVPGQFPTSLFAEMEVCEAYGDLSEEEEGEEQEEEEKEEEETEEKRNEDKEEEREELREKSAEEREKKSDENIGMIDEGLSNLTSFENVTDDHVLFPDEKVGEEINEDAVDRHSSGS